MTIQKAIKSGKWFARKEWRKSFRDPWVMPVSKKRQRSREIETLRLRIADILATDWEVKK